MAAKKKIIDKRNGVSRMEKMPIIKNGAAGPGKVGTEKPSVIIRPIAPPPPERAKEPEQKQKVIQALLETWLNFPYLRLGQLVSLASDKASVFYIEDEVLRDALTKFQHNTIRCDSWSASRRVQCTLDFGHDGERHFNQFDGSSWRRF